MTLQRGQCFAFCPGCSSEGSQGKPTSLTPCRLTALFEPAKLSHREQGEQAGAHEAECSRLGHPRWSIRSLPRLRTRIAAGTVGEVGCEVCRAGTAGTESRVQNEVVGAETAGPSDLELEVAEIGVGATIARGAVDRDAEGPIRSHVAIARAEAEDPKSINTARRQGEGGADTSLRARQGEREWRMRPTGVDEPILRRGRGSIDQVDEDVHGRAIDLRKRYHSNVGGLDPLADRERADRSGKSWTCRHREASHREDGKPEPEAFEISYAHDRCYETPTYRNSHWFLVSSSLLAFRETIRTMWTAMKGPGVIIH